MKNIVSYQPTSVIVVEEKGDDSACYHHPGSHSAPESKDKVPTEVERKCYGYIEANCIRSDTEVSKIFTKIMLQGKVNAAIKYLSENNDCGVLTVNNEVVDKLREKHPTPGDIAENSLLNGPIPQTPASYFDNISESTIRKAASLTKGAAGPSKLDAKQFKIMLVSNKFRKEGQDLRENIAIMAKKLATQIVDPATLEAYTACNLIPLIPLDKGGEKLDVRPIGVGEVLRIIIGKVISWTLKEDIQLAAGPLQTATGLESGAEAAIHAMKEIFDDA